MLEWTRYSLRACRQRNGGVTILDLPAWLFWCTLPAAGLMHAALDIPSLRTSSLPKIMLNYNTITPNIFKGLQTQFWHQPVQMQQLLNTCILLYNHTSWRSFKIFISERQTRWLKLRDSTGAHARIDIWSIYLVLQAIGCGCGWPTFSPSIPLQAQFSKGHSSNESAFLRCWLLPAQTFSRLRLKLQLVPCVDLLEGEVEELV